MWKLTWLDSAIEDMVRLREFLAQENPEAAKRAAETIKKTAHRLIEFPEVGKPIRELPLYRDLFIRFGAGGYILRYRVSSETLYIVHIRHYRESVFRSRRGAHILEVL